MTSLEEAIRLDVRGEVVAAALAYDELIDSGSAPLDVYLNAALLHWQATDFGFAAGYHLPSEFASLAWDRYPQILAAAARAYPNASEVQFWKLCCAWVSFGTPILLLECQELVDSGGTKVPYFYLYVKSEGSAYRAEVRDLIEACDREPTAKNRFIASMVAAVQSAPADAGGAFCTSLIR